MTQPELFPTPIPFGVQPATRPVTPVDPNIPPQRFNGADYVPQRDNERLSNQYRRIFELMRDGQWRTLTEIANATGDPHASISAQLRHMRKPRFGSHLVMKRHRGEPANGLYEYRVAVRVEN